MSIEGIELEKFSALHKTLINTSTKSCQLHVVFHYFLSYDSKQDSYIPTAHSKIFIAMLKETLLTSSLSTIWENTDGCAEQYICALAL